MKRSLIALALIAALPFAASAQDAKSGLSYNYAEAGYTKLNSSLNADGWAVKGSAALAPNVHVFGGYSKVDFDSILGVSPNAELWEIGVGYNRSISAKADFVGTLAYQKANASASGVSADSDGYAAEAGVRGALTPKLEGYALAGYQDGNDIDGDFYGRLGAQLKFNQTWGVVADVKFADGDTQFFVGPRFTW